MTSSTSLELAMQHLTVQDAELLRHTRMLIHLLEKNNISLQQVEAEIASSGPSADGFVQSQSAPGRSFRSCREPAIERVS